MGVGVGDSVDFATLPFGDLRIVGLVGEPFNNQSADVLLAPGITQSLVGDPEYALDSTLLLKGPDAENAAFEVRDLWYEEGQQLFWPAPAVDPPPPELEFMAGDPIYLLLNAGEIDELVDLVRTSDGTQDEIWNEAWSRATQMVYGLGEYRSLPDIYADTRSQWVNQGSFESTPGATSTAAAAILLVEVAFITGAAFAAGTRRRLRELGLMGANGASREHVRSTVVAEGLTIGAVGASVGVLLGIGVLVLGRPIIQRFVGRVITGLGVGALDLLGPVVVALISILLAVLIPARTASRVPTTTALQGRMPALSPRRWVIPIGIGLAVAGVALASVSLTSTSNLAGLLAGVGATAIVGGVAMLSSPILAGLAKLSNRVPATGRLVLRDSGRNRTRSAVAVAAIMVILLAPIAVMAVLATTAKQDLIFGLPSPHDQLVLSGSYQTVGFGQTNPITESDIAALSAIVPERDVAMFDTLDVRALTNEILEVQDSGAGDGPVAQEFVTNANPVALANEALVRVLADDRVTTSIAAGEVVVLGIEDKETRVELDGVVYPAHEYPVPVVRWMMPRVLIPESMKDHFT
ncbi:MAG: FtsX-like permease family protein, partial [Acidimicrobiia bacterium]